MNKLPKFILVGFLFATVVEFQFNLLATNNLSNYIFTLFYYPIYLLFVYFSSKIIDNIFKKKLLANIIYYFVYGFIGLAIEWFIMGNSPTGNPDANQLGMFAFWVALSYMPRIFTDPNPKLAKLKKYIKIYFITYTISSIALGLILPFAYTLFWVVWLQVVAYTFMNVFYIWYLTYK